MVSLTLRPSTYLELAMERLFIKSRKVLESG
jgi:hypothetical protein